MSNRTYSCRTVSSSERPRESEMRAEFSDLMIEMGLAVEPPHPIMDGRPHRVPVEGKSRANRSGKYVLYPDGWPAGSVTNFILGESKKWKASGAPTLSHSERRELRRKIARITAEKEAEEARVQADIAAKIRNQLAHLDVALDTPYTTAKRVSSHGQLFTNASRTTTYIPQAGAIRDVLVRPSPGACRYLDYFRHK